MNWLLILTKLKTAWAFVQPYLAAYGKLVVANKTFAAVTFGLGVFVGLIIW